MGSTGASGYPAPKTADLIGIMGGNGNIYAVSAVNPVPITGSITATNPSVGPNGGLAPLDSTLIGGVNGSGFLEPVNVDANKNLQTVPQTPVAGTVSQKAITVGTSAVRCTVSGSAPSTTRVMLMVQPDSSSTANFWIGGSSVANSGSSRGIPLAPGATFFRNSDAGDYYIISDTATQTVYVMEQ